MSYDRLYGRAAEQSGFAEKTPRWTVEALREPNGEGSGWDPCDDADAHIFAVWDEHGSEGWTQVADTREAAQAICDRLNAESV